MRKKQGIRYIIGILTVVVVLLLQATTITASVSYRTYTQDGDGRYVETQTAYEPVGVITQFGDLRLNGPQDMVITNDEVIYIADTDNRRIVKATLEGELLSVIGEGDLSKPMGIYVTPHGLLYVADEALRQVLVFNQEGDLIETYGKPDHPLYGMTTPFDPQKVMVDARGTMYITSRGNSNGIIQLSPIEGGTFLGYVGANDTRVTLLTLFRKAIFTDAQLARMTRSEPVSITNMHMDRRGLIYTVSQGEQNLTLKKMNIAGRNMIHPMVYDLFPSDVIVGPLDNIFVASRNGFIYEYNSEGSLMFVFGARDDGKQRVGLFKTVTSIALDQDAKLYVLDAEKNEVLIFKTTEFADLVHEGIALYQDGNYEASKAPWEVVLRMNSMFDYANLGMGEAFFKEGDYEQALHFYQLAKYRPGYSEAFWEVRNNWMKQNIGWLMVLLVFFYLTTRVLKWQDKKRGILSFWHGFKDKIMSVTLLRELFFIRYIMKNPADGYYGIRREGKVSTLAAHIWLMIAFLVYLFEKYGTAYIFRFMREGYYEIFEDFYTFFGLVLLVVVCNYLVTAINDGEGRFVDLYRGFVYALGPYIFLKPILTIVSHGLTYNEIFIMNFGHYLIMAWTLINMVLMIKFINDYTFKETFKIIFLTLFMVLISVLMLFIVYVLTSQVIEFVQTIFGEAVYKLVN